MWLTQGTTDSWQGSGNAGKNMSCCTREQRKSELYVTINAVISLSNMA